MPSFIRITGYKEQGLIATHAIETVWPDTKRPVGVGAIIVLVSGKTLECDQSFDQIQAALVNTDDCSIGKP
jgi:hypothetical protein